MAYFVSAIPAARPKNTGEGSLSLLQQSSQPRNQTRVSCIAGGSLYVGGKHTKWIILKKISTFHPKILTRGQRRRQRDEPTEKGKDQGGGSPHRLSRRPQPLFHPPRRHSKKREAGRGSRAGQSRWVTLETRAREPGAGWGAATGGRQEDPQQVWACGGVGRGAEAGEGPLDEL